jgi:hypothetical protein
MSGCSDFRGNKTDRKDRDVKLISNFFEGMKPPAAATPDQPLTLNIFYSLLPSIGGLDFLKVRR